MKTLYQALRDLDKFTTLLEKAQIKDDKQRIQELLPVVTRLSQLTNQPCSVCEE